MKYILEELLFLNFATFVKGVNSFAHFKHLSDWFKQDIELLVETYPMQLNGSHENNLNSSNGHTCPGTKKQ